MLDEGYDTGKTFDAGQVNFFLGRASVCFLLCPSRGLSYFNMMVMVDYLLIL